MARYQGILGLLILISLAVLLTVQSKSHLLEDRLAGLVIAVCDGCYCSQGRLVEPLS